MKVGKGIDGYCFFLFECFWESVENEQYIEVC